MKAKIQDIAYHLPEQIVTNADLQAENPTWDMKKIEQYSGVFKRHIANKYETALDLAFQACQKLLYKNPNLINQIDGLIFCTQSPDYIMPPNACILHHMLDLPDSVMAFDYNLACSGYPYGLALAQGLIHSRQIQNLVLVTADTYSKYIHPQDRSVRVLFGDGAAVSWITASNSEQGIIDIRCATSGKNHQAFMIPAGACRTPQSKETNQRETDSNGNTRTQENIHMNGLAVLAFVNKQVYLQIKQILADNQLVVEDVDLYIFHQASRLALDALTRRLKLSPKKVFRNLSEIGNVVSASIPIALQEAMKAGKAKSGDKIVLCGFGVGLSYSTVLLQI